MADEKVVKLAARFKAILTEWLSEEERAEVVRLNNDPAWHGCCATHDFCDANEAMAEAFRREGMGSNFPDDDDWNTAWDLFKAEIKDGWK